MTTSLAGETSSVTTSLTGERMLNVGGAGVRLNLLLKYVLKSCALVTLLGSSGIASNATSVVTTTFDPTTSRRTLGVL